MQDKDKTVSVTLHHGVMYEGVIYGPGDTEIPEKIYEEVIKAHDAHVTARQEAVPVLPTLEDNGDALIIRQTYLAQASLKELIGSVQIGLSEMRWSVEDILAELERQGFEETVGSSPAKPTKTVAPPAPINKPKEEPAAPPAAPKPARAAARVTKKTTAAPAEELPPPPPPPVPQPPADVPDESTAVEAEIPTEVLAALKEAGFDLQNPETIVAADDADLLKVAGVTDAIVSQLRDLTEA